MQQIDNSENSAIFMPIENAIIGHISPQKKKIYISGQISGLPTDKAIENFERAEKIIVSEGADPVNPMKNGLPENAPWELHMALDIVLLIGCEAVFLLQDWDHSRGATLEKTIAELTGKQIIYEKPTKNENIKQAITEVTGLLFHEIIGDSRKTISVHARMIYSYHCYTLMRIKETASDLHRSTSSIHYYLDQYRNEYKFNPAFRNLADTVSERIFQIQKDK